MELHSFTCMGEEDEKEEVKYSELDNLVFLLPSFLSISASWLTWNCCCWVADVTVLK